MYIRKIEIKNFRQLKNISIDIETELSLIIGKNNSGKTSILTAINKLLKDKARTISAYDFNLDFIKEIEEKMDLPIHEKKFSEFGISLKLYIEYTEKADLSNINELILDLDPKNNILVLGFEYLIATYKDLEAFKNKYCEERDKNTFNEFFTEHQKNYFTLVRRSYLYNIKTRKIDFKQYIDIDQKNINLDKVINFQYISAKRNVQNKETDKTLSEQSHKIYQKTEKNFEQNKPIEQFRETLKSFNKNLDPLYEEIFKDIIYKVKQFGGVKFNESAIKITSAIKQENLLKDNTSVMYTQNNAELPESHNGLGYMNLINMIFAVEILIQNFIIEFADINLLIIEEPEAHTHPQMQYIFIKNIKDLLKNRIVDPDRGHRNLQYMITSHSSHIVADSDFDDIKYLKKDNKSIIVKNLKDLRKTYDSAGKQYQFLKHYLTLHRAELFFADKAILYEGDTERILLPSMIKKFDLESPMQDSEILPLSSQNISLIEVGAYVQIYEKFLEFIGIRTLVITDIDSGYTKQKLDDDGNPEKHKNGNLKQKEYKCAASDPKAKFTRNHALIHFFQRKDLLYYKNLNKSQKRLSRKKHRTGICLAAHTNVFSNDFKEFKVLKNWVSNENGWLKIVYQVPEDSYHARSFEDAFIHINKNFIITHKDQFKSLKNTRFFNLPNKDSYNLAEECIEKKTHFALDIIYYSNETMSNWSIPAYIKEGLEWLQHN